MNSKKLSMPEQDRWGFQEIFKKLTLGGIGRKLVATRQMLSNTRSVSIFWRFLEYTIQLKRSIFKFYFSVLTRPKHMKVVSEFR